MSSALASIHRYQHRKQSIHVHVSKCTRECVSTRSKVSGYRNRSETASNLNPQLQQEAVAA
jgi:hypothetical protein